MTLNQQILQVASTLPEPRLEELLNFARFLQLQEERTEWRTAAQAQFAKAFGASEPEYSETDLKTPRQP